MLLKNECTQVSSVLVKLIFDDESVKVRLISTDDLIDVTYNANGMRKHIIGRVACVSTVGVDPVNWYIIVDGSDDFASERVRFSPATILDCEIIRKAAQDIFIKTPLGENGAPFLRLMKDRLQVSNDGINWRPIKINEEDVVPVDDVIDDQEGTVPYGRSPKRGPIPPGGFEEDGIQEAVY